MPEPRRRHGCNVAKAGARDLEHDRSIRLGGELLDLAPEVGQVLLGYRAIFFQVVLDVQVRFIDRVLANNRVKVPATGRHPAAGRQRPVSLWILQQVAVGLGVGVKTSRHPHRCAGKCRPLFPAFGPVAKHGAGPCQAHHVDAERINQVHGNLPKHQIGADHLDRCTRGVEPQRLAQLVHHADVHAGHAAAAQVQRDAVRFLVMQGQMSAFS